MKLIKLLSAAFTVLVFTSTLYAQRKEPSKEDIENFRAKKVSFITEKLQLTPEEAQKFWPIYNQSEMENWEAQNKRREIERKVQEENGNLSDKEIIDLTKQMVETFKAEALVSEKYNKKFLEILPPKKVLKLYQAEHQFRMQMLHEYRNRRPDDKPENR
jgi:Spy/CpxP family protein refolding chaperone